MTENNNMEEIAPKLLLDFLEEEFANSRMPNKLWRQLQKQYGESVYTEVLHYLTQMHFEQAEAREHWHKIIEHREALRIALGRDMGLRVAMADYFINIHPKVQNPIMVEINLFLKQEERAMKDELTGLYNRRFFNRMLQQEMDRSLRFEEPVSLIMADIDYFKVFNDRFGHLVGDQVLVETADVLRASSRSIDHLTRYGGEEFALILPRADRDEAIKAAERHRLAVARHRFQGREDLRITLSLGVATYPTDSETGLELLEKADQALYKAKQTRNQVQTSQGDKRRFERYPIQLNMHYRWRGNGRATGQGRTRNISLGGLLGDTNRRVKAGRTLELSLPMPDDQASLTVNGECVRTYEITDNHKSYQMGIRFQLDNQAQHKALEELISATEPYADQTAADHPAQ